MWPPDYCTTCCAYHTGGAHLPIFRVGIPEVEGKDIDPRDYPVIHASDAEEAAEKYAERWDNGDYALLNGSEVTVVVMDDMGYLSRWKVSGETVAVYHAEEVEEEE